MQINNYLTLIYNTLALGTFLNLHFETSLAASFATSPIFSASLATTAAASVLTSATTGGLYYSTHC